MTTRRTTARISTTSYSQRAGLRSAYLKLNELSLALTRAIEDAAGEGLSGNADIAVLGRLRDGPARPRELVGLTGLSSAGAANLIHRLEARNLVVRIRGLLDDRRGVVVVATPAGREVTSSIQASMCKSFDSLAPLRREILVLLGGPLPTSMSLGSAAAIERLAELGSELIHAMDLQQFPEGSNPSLTVIVLAAAAGDDGVRPRELIGLTRLSTGGVTLLLDRLEGLGLITRTTGRPPDRRAVVVGLTPAGEDSLNRCLDRLATFTDAIAHAVS